MQVFHGASRTRTGDLLGAIYALFWPDFGLTSGFPSVRVGFPNTFPNSLRPVLQYDNAVVDETGSGKSGLSRRRSRVQVPSLPPENILQIGIFVAKIGARTSGFPRVPR
jgi:hypothetical protein